MSDEQDGTQAAPEGEAVEVAEVTNDLTGEAAEATESEAGGEQPEGEQEQEAKPDKQTPSWAERRIGKLTAQKSAAVARADALERQLAAMAAPADDGTPSKLLPEEEIQRRAQVEAHRIASSQAFDARCNSIADQGKQKYPDFGKAIDAIKNAIGDENGIPTTFIEGVIEFDNAADIFHALGKDLDEADRIASLPVRRQAIELTKLSERLAKPTSRPVSRTPAPIKPIGGQRVESGLDDSLSIDEWTKRRNKQVFGK